MFDKYETVYVNTIEEYTAKVKEGCHPDVIEIKNADLLAYLKKNASDDDLLFAYAVELDKHDTNYEEKMSILLSLVNKSYIPAYGIFAINELLNSDLSDEDKQTYYDYLEAASEAGDLISQFTYSEYRLSSLDINDEARNYWIERSIDAAAKGYTVAQCIIGESLFSGGSTAAQREQGFYLLNLAAASENVEALVSLADAYIDGDLIERNYDKGIALLKKAASHDSINSLIKLGMEYWNNIGDSDHKEVSFEYFKKASNLGSTSGSLYCGILALPESDYLNDINLALEYLNKAADNDDGRAYDLIGDLYFRGEGVTEDKELAYSKFCSSAELNYPFGKYHKGYCLMYGLGVKKDHKLALEELNAAIKLGSVEAMTLLAELYIDGKELKKNIPGAIKLLKKAVKSDNGANQLLGKAYLELSIQAFKKLNDKSSKKIVKELKELDI